MRKSKKRGGELQFGWIWLANVVVKVSESDCIC